MNKNVNTEDKIDISRSMKGSKVPYMGCQSLFYQIQINKESGIRVKPVPDASDEENNHHSPVPTGVLIHQHSPQSIKSFSTYHSDNTIIQSSLSELSIKFDESPEDVIYDVPPREVNSINALTGPTNTSIHKSTVSRIFLSLSGLRKKPSILKRLQKDNSDVSRTVTANFLSLQGNLTNHLNKSLDSIPEAEKLKASIHPKNRQRLHMTYPNMEKSQDEFLHLFLKGSDNMYWTRSAVKRPLLARFKKSQYKEVITCFKVIQKYMGDRKTKKSPSELIRELHKRILSNSLLKDEVLVQICRQTVDNPDNRSRQRGWELLSECLSQFSPSIYLKNHLKEFISFAIDEFNQTFTPTINMNLNNLLNCDYYLSLTKDVDETSPKSTGFKGHQRQRSLSESQHNGTKDEGIQSVFRCSITAIMDSQRSYFPTEPLPIILKTLCNQISKDLEKSSNFISLYKSLLDISYISQSVMIIDKWCSVVCRKRSQKLKNAPSLQFAALHVMIFWFESLSQPLLNEELAYQPVSLKSISELNRMVMLYVIDLFKTQIIKKSKDNVHNMASFLCALFFQLPKERFYPIEAAKESVHMSFVLSVFQDKL